ncbi:MAG TPA: c-type cytochrome, partial [Methylomirabilota bacterium]|nr:c-type cytochrome [Methylomirabilota bacterium]
PPERQLRALRVVELALARGGDAIEAHRRSVRTALRPLFPRADRLVKRELSRLLWYVGDTSIIDPLLDLMASDTGGRPPLGSGYFVRNPKYGAAVRDMIESAPRLERMHHAQMLLWLDDGWSVDQRRRYLELIADAMKHSRGGHQYNEFWNRIRGIALDQVPEDQRERFESIPAAPVPGLADGLPTPSGPGRDWSLGLEAALELVRQGLEGRDLLNGRTMYSAAGCVVCHRFNGEGGAIGPDLSSIGQRFTARDILDATLHPSRAISDQYQVTTLDLDNGSTLSGRIVSRDTTTTRIAPNLMKPTESIAVENASIRRERREPVSTMPSGLLNPLNEDELLDLLAYLVSGGERNGSTAQP